MGVGGLGEKGYLSQTHTPDCPGWGHVLFPAGQGPRCYLGMLPGAASLLGDSDLAHDSLGVAPRAGARQDQTKFHPIIMGMGQVPAVRQDGG